MEFQLKKQAIVSQVEYSNLLTFTLAENKLQRNFRSIVEALLLNQNKTDALNDDHLQFKEANNKEILKINHELQQIKNLLQNLQNNHNNTSDPNLSFQKQVTKLPFKQNFQINPFPLQDGLKLKQDLNELNNKFSEWQNKVENDRGDLMNQIRDLKNKLNQIGAQQQEAKNLRNEQKNMKRQSPPSDSGLKNNGTLSSKTLSKRSSILNLITNKQSEKSIQQPTKKSTKVFNKDENQQNSLNEAIQKQFNSLYLDLNTLKISFEELKDQLSDNRKQSLKNNSLLSQLKDDLAREVKTRKYETEDLQKSIKDLKLQLLNISNHTNEPNNHTEDKSSTSSTNQMKVPKPANKQADDNFKYQINDKVLRLQAMIQNLITQSEFNRLKNDLNDQIDKLTKKVDSVGQNLENTEKKLQDLIVQNQVNTNSEINDLKKKISQIQENAKNQSNQNQRKNNILNAKIQELKKSLQNLREDLEFYQSLMAENNKNNQKQQKKSDQANSQDKQADKNGSSGVDEKALQALKKYFGTKLHDLRTNLLGLIRDLEKKLNYKPNNDQDIVQIWDRLNELNLFLGKKADNEDAKKTFMYLEKKINRLNSEIFKNEDNTDDARIAKTNWYCLSCDKNLQTYQGKIGRHVVWDSMPLKGINKTVMVQNEEKKKALPQLKK